MRNAHDPRWRGVAVPSLHSVVLRVLQDGENFDDTSARAWAALKSGQVWREYEAVMHPNKAGQIIGYRRVNNKAWFILSDDGGLDGPFPSKKLCLSKLRTKTSNKVGSGIYLATDSEGMEHTLFTRDMAPEVGLQVSELP